MTRIAATESANDGRNKRTGLVGFCRQLAGGRAAVTLGVSALSSTGTFGVSVAVAHVARIDELGQFVLALSAYVLWVGLARAIIAESVLADVNTSAVSAGATRRACMVGLVGAATTGVGGLALGSAHLVLMAVCLPGLMLYDHLKIVSLGVACPRRALLQELCWAGLSLVSVLFALHQNSGSLVIFGAWAGSGAVVGFATALIDRCPVLPGWGLTAADSRQALSFGAQHLVTSGSAQLSMAGLAATAGASVVGALGVGRTVLGPMTLLVSTMSLLTIPRLARYAKYPPSRRLRSTVLVTAAAVGLTVPLALICSEIPDRLGRIILRENWEAAEPLVPVLAVETILGLVSAAAFAGHRVEKAGVRALCLGVAMGIARIAVVTVGGLVAGPSGLAYLLVLIAAGSAVMWWASYVRLLRARRRPSG